MNISIQELDKYIALTHEEVQYISQKTQSITNANIIGWNKIPLFRESHGIRKCGQNVEFINIKAGSTHINLPQVITYTRVLLFLRPCVSNCSITSVRVRTKGACLNPF